MRSSRDLSNIRSLPSVKHMANGGQAELCNYKPSGGKTTIRWGLNYPADRDEIFEIRIGDEIAYLDWQELQHYLRMLTGVRSYGR